MLLPYTGQPLFVPYAERVTLLPPPVGSLLTPEWSRRSSLLFSYEKFVNGNQSVPLFLNHVFCCFFMLILRCTAYFLLMFVPIYWL